MPPGLRQTLTPLSAAADARVKTHRERLLNALTKMNDRDTQKDAAADIEDMVRVRVIQLYQPGFGGTADWTVQICS